MAAGVRTGLFLGTLLMAGNALAQPVQVTEADYRRAAAMLGDRTAPLLDHVVSAPVWLGDADDLPVTGDWNGDGRTDLGVYDKATATFTLRTVTADGLSLLDIQQFGAAGDLHVTGDWDGKGVTYLGVWSPATGTFSQSLSATPMAARAAVRTVRFGRPRR